MGTTLTKDSDKLICIMYKSYLEKENPIFANLMQNVLVLLIPSTKICCLNGHLKM